MSYKKVTDLSSSVIRHLISGHQWRSFKKTLRMTYHVNMLTKLPKLQVLWENWGSRSLARSRAWLSERVATHRISSGFSGGAAHTETGLHLFMFSQPHIKNSIKNHSSDFMVGGSKSLFTGEMWLVLGLFPFTTYCPRRIKGTGCAACLFSAHQIKWWWFGGWNLMDE